MKFLLFVFILFFFLLNVYSLFLSSRIFRERRNGPANQSIVCLVPFHSSRLLCSFLAFVFVIVSYLHVICAIRIFSLLLSPPLPSDNSDCLITPSLADFPVVSSARCIVLLVQKKYSNFVTCLCCFCSPIPCSFCFCCSFRFVWFVAFSVNWFRCRLFPLLTHLHSTLLSE